MRRGRLQAPVTLAEWNLNWLQDGEAAVAGTVQRPKLWEVAVDDGGGGGHVIQSWEKAMPLSAISLDPDLSSSNEADKSAHPARPSSSWLPRLGYFSLARPPSKDAAPQPITRTQPHDHLQVSLIIVMPSPSPPQRPRATQAERDQQVTAQEVDEDTGGAPEIAFGVIVLPSEKESLHAHKDEISDD